MSTLIPCLRYRDAPAAIEWLCRVLGCEKHLVVPGPAGTILHAQLNLGRGMIMLGSDRHDNEYGRLIRQPDEIGGCETQSVYVVVDDADAVLARALQAGAEIVIPIADQPHGGRLFACRDPGGHLWSIGSYDPWAEAGSA